MKARTLCLLTVAVSLALGINDSDAVQAAAPPEGPVRVDSRSPHYFQYRGQPLILVTSDHTWFAATAADFDYVRFFDALAANHNNFTRIYPGAHPVNYENQPLLFPWARRADGRYDLDQWNSACFERLHVLQECAQARM